jgi:predicted nucleic acid-binding Zn ribbon protein
MTQREQLLIDLFKIDADYCSRVRQGYEESVAAPESRVFCKECGRKFIPEHPASKFCSPACRGALDKRRYRTRVGKAL